MGVGSLNHPTRTHHNRCGALWTQGLEPSCRARQRCLGNTITMANESSRNVRGSRANAQRRPNGQPLAPSGTPYLDGSPGTHVGTNAELASADTHLIPDVVIRRLPIYVRTLHQLQDRDVRSVSSETLADLIGVTAAQIRRDLSYFGKFGKQGKGYDVAYLSHIISHILKLDRQWPVVLAGLGNLGRAIANYRGFAPSSFAIAALVDRNPRNIGQTVGELEVQPEEQLPEIMRADDIRIGIIAASRGYAQDVADLMVEGGVQAILNYAPVILKVPETVTVREIDPISALQSMTYYLDDPE